MNELNFDSISKFAEAIKIYDKSLDTYPENIGALIDKATTLQRIWDNKKSLKLFNVALRIAPKNIDVLIGKGSVLHALEKYDDEIVLYDKALKINKKFALAYAYKVLA